MGRGKKAHLLTGEILRHVNNSESNDVDAAVDTAKGAFAKWSKVTAFERGKILIKAASIIRVSNLQNQLGCLPLCNLYLC